MLETKISNISSQFSQLARRCAALEVASRSRTDKTRLRRLGSHLDGLSAGICTLRSTLQAQTSRADASRVAANYRSVRFEDTIDRSFGEINTEEDRRCSYLAKDMGNNFAFVGLSECADEEFKTYCLHALEFIKMKFGRETSARKRQDEAISAAIARYGEQIQSDLGGEKGSSWWKAQEASFTDSSS